MKQIVFFILLFSVTLAFAQTEQASSSGKEDGKTGEIAVKAQKVSEIRHVVIIGHTQMAKDLQNQKRIGYDMKGGIIVPNASKGIQQTQLNPQQKMLVNRMEKAKRQATSERNDVILEKQTSKKMQRRSESQKKRNE